MATPPLASFSTALVSMIQSCTPAISRGTQPAVATRIVYDGPVRAPIAQGAQVAGLEVRIEGRTPHYLPLVAAEAVHPAGPIDRLVNGLLGVFE